MGSAAAWVDLSSYTVQANDDIVGATTIYLYRATAKSTYFNNFKITRPTSTSIINTKGDKADDSTVYDLMGRRVTTPQAGKLYILNGKKMIFR